MVRAATAGMLDEVATETVPILGLKVPVAVPGVPDGIHQPRRSWANADAYDAAPRALASGIEVAVERPIGSAVE